jgi:hypothetical protein
MMNELGAWLWIVIDVVAVAALAAGIVYGAMQWRARRKDAAARAARDRATRALYQEESRSAGG